MFAYNCTRHTKAGCVMSEHPLLLLLLLLLLPLPHAHSDSANNNDELRAAAKQW